MTQYPKQKWVEKGVAEGHQKGECRVGHRAESSKIRGVQGVDWARKEAQKAAAQYPILPTLDQSCKLNYR